MTCQCPGGQTPCPGWEAASHSTLDTTDVGPQQTADALTESNFKV